MKIVKFDSKASWTVAMACLFLNFLVLIPTKVSGLFFVEILDRYQVGRNLGGYPAFISTLMRCSGGPFAGYFAEKFGINEVMLLGSLLTSIGISACFFAEDISAVILLLGLIHGIGLAFTNTFLPHIVMIHFRKHLSLAFGITQTGACLGSFFSPPLLVWIFQSYGTSGGFLIIGAIVLNGLPIILILNILSPNKFYAKSGNSMKYKKCSSEGEDNITNKVDRRDVRTRKEKVVSEIGNNLENKAVTAVVMNIPTNNQTEVEPGKKEGVLSKPATEPNKSSLSVKEIDSKTVKDQNELVFAECRITSELKSNNTNHEEKMKERTEEKIKKLQYEFKETASTKLMKNNQEGNLQHSNDCTNSKTEYKLKAEIKDRDVLKYQKGEEEDCYPSKDGDSNTPPFTSESNVPASKLFASQDRAHLQDPRENREIIPINLNTLNRVSLGCDEPSNHKIDKKEVFKNDKKSTNGTLNAKKSFKIFLDITFWIVIITQSIHVFVLVIFWTTMIDFSRDKNIERSKEVYLLMALPIAEIIGRVGLGWITDRGYFTKIKFSILFFILMGCSCSLMAWAQGFNAVMASIFVLGVFSSGLSTIFAAIVFEFFDSANQTMGQASKFCLFGPLSFLNGPLVGYFRVTLGSYAWLYHTMAMVSVACAALSILIPVLARRRDKKKIRKSLKFYESTKDASHPHTSLVKNST